MTRSVLLAGRLRSARWACWPAGSFHARTDPGVADPPVLGTHRRRVRRDRPHHRPRPQPPRVGDVLGDVVGALLLQVVAQVHLKRQFGEKKPETDALLVGHRARTPACVDIGDGIAAAVTFKVESHNHPSVRSSRIRARPPVSAASSATSCHHGCTARSRSWIRCASARSTPRDTRSRCCRGHREPACGRLRQLASACPTSAARWCSTRRMLEQPARQRAVHRRHEARATSTWASAKGVGNLVGAATARRTGGDGIGGVSACLASADVR